MDKQTLSNYGWIVICILVLSVMLALATPFGTFCANGFKATYTGFEYTGNKALKTVLPGSGNDDGGNTPDTPDVPVAASCGIEGHYEGDGLSPHGIRATCGKHQYTCQCDGWVVPVGGKYQTNSAIYNENEKLPCGYILNGGDKYFFGDYEYYYWGNYPSKGVWKVSVVDTTKNSYGEILTEILGKPVADMDGTFKNCVNMTQAPAIPENVKILEGTFEGCISLEKTPFIPNTVTSLSGTFIGCTSLTYITNLPDDVEYLSSAFKGCTSLTNLSYLTIPVSVKKMDMTFYNCKSLTYAPVITRDNLALTEMGSTFNGCTSLLAGANGDPLRIPDNVSNLTGAFASCKSFSGKIYIFCNPTSYSLCFAGSSITTSNASSYLACGGNCTQTILNKIVKSR